MVALAAGSSSRSTEISYQTKITAVMLGRVDKPIDARDEIAVVSGDIGGRPERVDNLAAARLVAA